VSNSLFLCTYEGGSDPIINDDFLRGSVIENFSFCRAQKPLPRPRVRGWGGVGGGFVRLGEGRGPTAEARRGASVCPAKQGGRERARPVGQMDDVAHGIGLDLREF